MEIAITLTLIIFLIVALAVLVKANKKSKNNSLKEQILSMPAPDCCGAHEVCEYDVIKMDESRIEYYNDEELDVYRNIPTNQYTDEQIDEFREVLFTLRNEEIRYWLLSIERRKIQLPEPLHAEARMLLAEAD